MERQRTVGLIGICVAHQTSETGEIFLNENFRKPPESVSGVILSEASLCQYSIDFCFLVQNNSQKTEIKKLRVKHLSEVFLPEFSVMCLLCTCFIRDACHLRSINYWQYSEETVDPIHPMHI